MDQGKQHPMINRRHRLFQSALIVALLLVIASGGWAEIRLDPALEQAIASRKQTADEAQQYTYTEHKIDRTFDSKGNVKQDSSDTYEIIFLEGAPYQKHTLHNDRPLPEKEQQNEDKKLADVTKTRHDTKDKAGLFSGQFRIQLPIDQIPARFDVAAASPNEEEIDGRKMLVFTAVPRAGADGIKEMSRDGLAYAMKLWVDEEDKVLAKIDAKVVADGMRYENGSLLEYNWKKVNNEAWLPERFWFKGKVRYMMTNVPAETVQTYSDYKKFRADARSVPE